MCYQFFICRFVYPLRKLSDLDTPPYIPVIDEGIVFHVYSDNQCQSSNRYMDNLELNIDAILRMDKQVYFFSGIY